MLKIALTGHRPDKLAGYALEHPFYDAMHAWLGRIIDNAITHHPEEQLSLHSGMALGADTVWAMAIVAAKQRHPGRIRFVAEIPTLSQPARWSSSVDRRRWEHLKDQADEANVYAERYSVQCLHDRNRGMITGSDLLLAVWNGEASGGTAGSVRIAQQQGIRVFPIDPAAIREQLTASRQRS